MSKPKNENVASMQGPRGERLFLILLAVPIIAGSTQLVVWIMGVHGFIAESYPRSYVLIAAILVSLAGLLVCATCLCYHPRKKILWISLTLNVLVVFQALVIPLMLCLMLLEYL